MPQITTFAVQEAVIKTVEAAVDAYGLKSLPGSDGEINVNEDVKDMASQWKEGESLIFTTNFAAIFDPEKVTSKEDEGDSDNDGDSDDKEEGEEE